MKNVAILFISLLLIGCATRNKDLVRLPSNAKLLTGYSLVKDNEQKIRVVLPDGTTNGLPWENEQMNLENVKQLKTNEQFLPKIYCCNVRFQIGRAHV